MTWTSNRIDVDRHRTMLMRREANIHRSRELCKLVQVRHDWTREEIRVLECHMLTLTLPKLFIKLCHSVLDLTLPPGKSNRAM